MLSRVSALDRHTFTLLASLMTVAAGMVLLGRGQNAEERRPERCAACGRLLERRGGCDCLE